MKLEPHRVGGERSHWENRAFARRTLKLGFELAESTVSKYMIRRRHPPSQSWRTFLRNHAEAIAAIDLCLVPTVRFESLFAFVIIGHGRRQLLWFAVTRHPTAEWLAQQIVEAFPWETAPAYLVRDNDGAYGPVFKRRVRAMGIRDRPISPRSPWQNPYAERLIGTLRRDCLDHVVIFGARHLQRVLTAYTPSITIRRGRICRWTRTVSSGLAAAGIGSVMVNTAPGLSVRFAAVIVPCIASTKPRAIASPRPVPARTWSPFCARKNLSKMFSRSAGGMPSPSSMICSETVAAFCQASTWMVVPAGAVKPDTWVAIYAAIVGKFRRSGERANAFPPFCVWSKLTKL